MFNRKSLVALLIGAGLVFVISRLSLEPSLEQELEVAAVVDSSPPVELVRSVEGGMDFYRQLAVGSSLALQLGAGQSDAVVEVVVTQVVLEAEATSIKAVALSGEDVSGSLLMTIGDKFIHVFLALDRGIYEFSGKDFQGILERTTDMRFENDTAVSKRRSVELTDQPVRRQLEVPGNNQ